MALKRNERYVGRFNNPSAAHPQGAFKNRTSPTAQDGSYFEADWPNDWDGFFGRLLTVAGITPNGNVDTALVSQYFDALRAITLQRSNPFGDIQTDGTTNTALSNLGIGSAGLRNVGTATNQIPDMNSFLRGAGYQKFPGGFTIQWGTTAASAPGVVLTQAYNIAYTVPPTVTLCYVDSLIQLPATRGAPWQLGVVSATGFNYTHSGSSSNSQFQWISVGVV